MIYLRIFLFLLILITLSACQKEAGTQKYESGIKDDALSRKIEFILLGEHDGYDICYDHDTSACIGFFDEAVKRGLMSSSERKLSKEEDPNRPGHAWNPDFSEKALDIRREVLNRYFDNIRQNPKKYQSLLEKIVCEDPGCWRSEERLSTPSGMGTRVTCPTYGCKYKDFSPREDYDIFID